jgi:hypothetical protein
MYLRFSFSGHRKPVRKNLRFWLEVCYIAFLKVLNLMAKTRRPSRAEITSSLGRDSFSTPYHLGEYEERLLIFSPHL